MNEKSPCPSPEQWPRLIQADALPEELEAFAVHLENCEACQQRWEAALAQDPLVNLLQNIGSVVPIPVDQRMKEVMDQLLRLPKEKVRLAGGLTTKDWENRVSTVDGEGRFGATGATVSLPGYEILEELGRGGMGVVYKARQLSLKRIVALKMILAGPHAGADESARFRTEAEAVARLQHPNIVQIFEIGAHQGMAFFSLEFVPGGTLAARLGRERLSSADAAQLVGTLALAMHHAHSRGIIHRDLKPANVLLMPDGTPKISDFGLAKNLELNSGQTRSGAVMGTPSYMAPEQALGQIEALGPTTDVYALGAILYEFLTGRPPFQGRSVAETLEQVRRHEPVPPALLVPQMPRDLETICLKALAKDPARRYSSALAMADDLHRFGQGEPIVARRPSWWEVLGRRWRRQRGKLLTGLAIILIAAVAGTALFSSWQTSRTASLQRDIFHELEDLDGSAQQVDRLEQLIAQLELLSPQAAAEERRQLARRLEQFLDKQLMQPGFQADKDGPALEKTLTLLAARDKSAAQAMSKRFQERVQRWEPVFHLSAPFSQLQAVFPPKALQVQQQHLLAIPQAASKDGWLFTSMPGPANAEARVIFAAPSWEQASKLGLALSASPRRGYFFHLEILPDDLPPAAANLSPMQLARQHGGRLVLKIMRNEVLLRQETFSPGDVAEGPLELWVRRQGDHLQCQVNRLKVVEFFDLFPLAAGADSHFGLLVPPPVAVAQLAGQRKGTAAAPSPLEQGDALVEAGRLDEALVFYRRQANPAAADELGLQAHYKAGLCLLGLKRENEALKAFLETAAGVGQRWPVLADCQLWYLLQQKREREGAAVEADIDAVVHRLLGRGLREEQLAMLLPQDQRSRLLPPLPSRVDLFFRPDRHLLLRQLERRCSLEKLMHLEGQTRRNHLRALFLAYRCVGREDEALHLGLELLQNFQGLEATDVARQTAEHCAWILRRQNKLPQAMSLLNQWLNKQPPRSSSWWLVLEQARNYAALGQWAHAEKTVESILTTDQPAPEPVVLEAWCLRGFLHRRAGADQLALAAWHQGLSVAARPTTQALPNSPRTFSTVFLMTALTKPMDDAECRYFQKKTMEIAAGSSQMGFLTNLIETFQPPAVYREMWRSPRGQEVARKIVWRDCSYAEWAELPMLLNAFETLHLSALPGPLAPEDDQILWDLVSGSYQHFLAGKLDFPRLTPLTLVLKGTPLFWTASRDQLPPDLRSPVAYLMGHRYLRLQRPKDAQAFFQDALTLATPGSQLHNRAQTQLELLPKNFPKAK